MSENLIARQILTVAKELLAEESLPQNQYKKLLTEYLRKAKCQFSRLVSMRGSNEIVVVGWPRMQGQGLEAAGWMEEKWAKVLDFAKANGFRVRRNYE